MRSHKNSSGAGRVEFITFRVGEQEFCVEITSTREIRGWSKATPLPYSPDYIIGVINLRGTILPIMDLSARLGLGPSEPSERDVIIVARVNDKFVGLLVDSVSDILDVDPEELRALPQGGSPGDNDMFRRVIVMDNRIISEVSLEVIVPDEELQAA